MGSLLQAYCRTCGYSDMVQLGSGFADSDGKRYLWAFQCERCRNVVTVNGLAKTIRCPRCRSRRITPITANPAHARKPLTDLCDDESSITSGEHKCLHCGSATLTFMDAGCWD